MPNLFWPIFGIATALKVLLIPSYRSTDFEVHRNWLAITHSLPMSHWYRDETSEWTLDYPPLFAYFEWCLAQIAKYIDTSMLDLNNLNYESNATIYFQRSSVIVTDIIYAFGVKRCLNKLPLSYTIREYCVGEILLLLNLGLIFIDHIHFQYNGFLYGILLLSISYMLEDKYLIGTFIFAILLNFKHIFLYIAPAFAIYLLKFYSFKPGQSISAQIKCLIKVFGVGIIPFIFAFAPFIDQLPNIIQRLFPFKRGLTHAYWAPNFWALYNTLDKVLPIALHMPLNKTGKSSTTSGLVQDNVHNFLPTITPMITFILTGIFMLPIIIKLGYYTPKRDAKPMFLRAIVLCACSSFVFGWHVHEKAILMCLIPMCLLTLNNRRDAKYAFILSAVGYFSFFPLLFETELFIIRYSLYTAYMCAMYSQLARAFKIPLDVNIIEWFYIFGLIGIPIYEHIISKALKLDHKYPFMPLLLTSVYCSLGILYFFTCYYNYTLKISIMKLFCVSRTTQKTSECNRIYARNKTKTRSKHKNN